MSSPDLGYASEPMSLASQDGGSTPEPIGTSGSQELVSDGLFIEASDSAQPSISSLNPDNAPGEGTPLESSPPINRTASDDNLSSELYFDPLWAEVEQLRQDVSDLSDARSELHATFSQLEQRMDAWDNRRASAGVDTIISANDMMRRNYTGLEALSARALLMWCMYHLEPLAITDPDYALDKDCSICHEPFNLNCPSRTPMRIKGIQGCNGHVFGNKCILEWITSGRDNANTCPLCRSELMGLVDGKLLPPLEDSDSEYEPDVGNDADEAAQRRLALVETLPEEPEGEDQARIAGTLQPFEIKDLSSIKASIRDPSVIRPPQLAGLAMFAMGVSMLGGLACGHRTYGSWTCAIFCLLAMMATAFFLRLAKYEGWTVAE